MYARRNGTKAPVLSTTMTCKDEDEYRRIQAYLTRDGRTQAGSIMALIRSAMRTNESVHRGETCVDLDVIRRAQEGLGI